MIKYLIHSNKIGYVTGFRLRAEPWIDFRNNVELFTGTKSFTWAKRFSLREARKLLKRRISKKTEYRIYAIETNN